MRVRPDAIERVILGWVRCDLLALERVKRMAHEMRSAHAERMRQMFVEYLDVVADQFF